MEVWKEIDGYENYSVSNLGRIRKGNYIMSLVDNGLGYKHLKLRRDGKRKSFYVHRLVMIAFSPIDFSGLEVNHIDHDKSNNKLDNLEWVTHKENLIKAVEKLGKGAFVKH